MSNPVTKPKRTRYLFTIYARPGEDYNVGTEIDLTIIGHNKKDALIEAKRLIGKDYKYFRIKNAEPVEIYKMREC